MFANLSRFSEEEGINYIMQRTARLMDVRKQGPNLKVLSKIGPDGKSMVEVAGTEQTWTWALERGLVSNGGSLGSPPAELTVPRR